MVLVLLRGLASWITWAPRVPQPPFWSQASLPCDGPVSPSSAASSGSRRACPVKGWSSPEGQVGAKSEGRGRPSRYRAWRSMQALNS